LDYFLNSSWLIESVLNTMQNIIDIKLMRQKVQEELRSGEHTDKEVAEINAGLQKKVNGNYLAIFTCALDATMAFGFLNKKVLSFIFLDFLGVVTSLIGTHQAWPR